jgi:hypothetical protein
VTIEPSAPIAVQSPARVIESDTTRLGDSMPDVDSPAVSSAPELEAAMIDPDGGLLLLRFDRTVALSTARAALSRLHIYGDDPSCSAGSVEPRDVVGDQQSNRLALAFESVPAGATHVAIDRGFVRGDEGAPNERVACTPTAAVRAPVLESATADPDAGTVTLRFDSAVDRGDGSMAPMNLIVYGDDATCQTPAGNGHRYLAGLGTRTVTVEATSLELGTTYIGVVSGFVEGHARPMPNRAVRCLAVSAAAA